MNSHLQERLHLVESALKSWLSGYNQPESPIQRAIDKTISDALFSAGDVHFAVNHLTDTVLDGQPRAWLSRLVQGDIKDCSNDTVLCLHAGNLPLVGFQDVLAVLLSGAAYAGKLSRKDPWLLRSFLEVLQREGLNLPVEMNDDLASYESRQFKRWMFAGSEDGLAQVTIELKKSGVLHPVATSLLRTAHFSVANLPDWDDAHIPDLIDSILRYAGKGCRSVAMVYTSVPLEQIAAKLQDAGQRWANENHRNGRLSPIILYRKAYNDAVGIPSVVVGTHLIQQGIASPDFPEIVYWQQFKSHSEPRLTYANMLQEVYGPQGTPLREAQRPPIDWKPDGQDPLEWLLTANLR